MERLRSQLDPALLLEEAERLSYTKDSSGVRMAAQQAKGFPSWFNHAPNIVGAVAEIERLTGKQAVSLMVNRLEPGILVPVHRDAPGAMDRWHLPVKTNADALWWDEQFGERPMETRYWHGPVPYMQDHQVRNRGTEARVHIVVDLS